MKVLGAQNDRRLKARVSPSAYGKSSSSLPVTLHSAATMIRKVPNGASIMKQKCGTPPPVKSKLESIGKPYSGLSKEQEAAKRKVMAQQKRSAILINPQPKRPRKQQQGTSKDSASGSGQNKFNPRKDPNVVGYMPRGRGNHRHPWQYDREKELEDYRTARPDILPNYACTQKK